MLKKRCVDLLFSALCANKANTFTGEMEGGMQFILLVVIIGLQIDGIPGKSFKLLCY